MKNSITLSPKHGQASPSAKLHNSFHRVLPQGIRAPSMGSQYPRYTKRAKSRHANPDPWNFYATL
jgi:hypothetical protein